MERKAFTTNKVGGFQICFPNGLILSTQFGPGHYCENRSMKMNHLDEILHGSAKDKNSNNAEIAVFWDKSRGGDWMTREIYKQIGKDDPQDDVVGWVGIEEWLEIFEACKNYKG